MKHYKIDEIPENPGVEMPEWVPPGYIVIPFFSIIAILLIFLALKGG